MDFACFVEPFAVFRTVGPCGERYGLGILDKTNHSWKVEPESNGFRISFLLQGYGTLKTPEGRIYDLSPGAVIQYSPGHTSVDFEPKCRCIECFVETGKSMFEVLKQCGYYSEHPVLHIEKYPALLEKISELQRNFLDCREEELPHLLPHILSFLLEILDSASFAKCPPEYRKIIETSCEYLAENFTVSEKLSSFCRKNGIGYENFRKIFKQTLGISPHQYRIRRRIDSACIMLLQETLSIGEISHKLGFCSAFEFSAQFRRLIGVSPSKFRKRLL